MFGRLEFLVPKAFPASFLGGIYIYIYLKKSNNLLHDFGVSIQMLY